MKQKFCSNPLCNLNKFDDNGRGEIEIENPENGFEFSRKLVKNHLYQNHDGTTLFYLCDTCHRAVELVQSS